MLMAGYFLYRRDPAKADESVGRAIRCCPDNPIAIYLTGEVQTSTGEFARAADSLERAAAGTKHEWLAVEIARRARALRDDPQRCEPLFFDFRFALQAIRAALADASLRSVAAARLHAFLDASAAFADGVWKELPDREGLEGRVRGLLEGLPDVDAVKDQARSGWNRLVTAAKEATGRTTAATAVAP
jgi:hypothetical protein